MTLDPTLEGKKYPLVPFVVERDHVQRFAAAVGDDGTFVPPTFVTAPEIAAGLAAAIADPDLGLDLARVLHGEQEYEWARPLRVGEALTCGTQIESIRAKGTTGFLTLRSELRDADGALVAVGRSTLIQRGEA
jgi:acyl dehydratase